MARSTWRGLVLWIALALLIPGAPGRVVAETGEDTTELPIRIEVVPAGGQVDPDAPYSPVRSGTVTAWIGGVRPGGEGRLAVLLLAEDTRGTAAGWSVQVTDSEGVVRVVRYLERTQALAGQPVDGERGPHGERLSLGQGGAVSAVVLHAIAGAGWGTYQIRFELGTDPTERDTPVVLVLTLPSAP